MPDYVKIIGAVKDAAAGGTSEMSLTVALTPELAEETTHVSEAIPRTDAPAKVAGEALYTMDLAPGDLLHATPVTPSFTCPCERYRPPQNAQE